jgi:hypothetical protein
VSLCIYSKQKLGAEGDILGHSIHVLFCCSRCDLGDPKYACIHLEEEKDPNKRITVQVPAVYHEQVSVLV